MPTPPTLLVVDDEENVRTYFSLVLRSAGYYVIEARTGAIALRAAEIRTPDLAVIDLNMPETDAGKLIDELQTRWPGLPVMVVSGGDPRLAPAGTPFLKKPLSPAELRTRVEHILRQSQSRTTVPYLNATKPIAES